MKDFAEVRWRDLFAVFVGTAVLLMAASMIRGHVLPSSTALVGLPVGGALTAIALAYAKRRQRR